MEDKVFLDEAGLGEVGKVISKFYASKDDVKNIDVTKQLDDYAKKDQYEKDYIQLSNDVVYLKSPKVLPDNIDIRDIKKDGLYIINAITAEYSPVKYEFSDYHNAETRGEEWHLPSYYNPYALLKVVHKGNDILYFLFDPMFDKIHCAIYSSEFDSFGWQTKELSFYVKDNILYLLNNIFNSNPALNHVVDDAFVDGWNLSSPYIQQVDFNYNTDNITARVTSMYDAGQPDCYETEDEGVFLLGATETSAGVMIASDKKKLNSIDVEKIVKKDDIVNDLTTGGADKSLSAEQGKQLNTQIKNLTQEIDALKTQLNELKTTPKE